MPDKKSNSYFTIGEFASLFGISKQTLFYYERSGIFAPALIEDNGYRYYSFEQYFIFEIIITLRKLGIPLKEISNYVKNRDIASLQKLFENKVLEYDIEISLLERNRDTLLRRIKRIEKTKEIKKSFITLENIDEEYLVADDFPVLDIPRKKQINLIAEHNLPFAMNEVFNEYVMGFILTRENLASGKYLLVDKIFTKITYKEEYPGAIVKPAGLYATITTPGGYHAHYKAIIDKLLAFISLNNLEIIGDVYINQLRNYWSTADHDQYITKIAIQVD